jgi:hypothetical protein
MVVAGIVVSGFVAVAVHMVRRVVVNVGRGIELEQRRNVRAEMRHE